MRRPKPSYSLLALTVVAMTLSLRKRWPRIRLGGFDAWRAVHAALGVALVGLLLMHTGVRLGSRLNLVLVLCFTGLMALGAGAAGVIGADFREANDTPLDQVHRPEERRPIGEARCDPVRHVPRCCARCA